jgi:hypothetical protein
MTDTTSDNEEKDFPGYPHYPAKEDIMNTKKSERVNIDVENISRSVKPIPSALPDKSISISPDEPEVPGDMDADNPETAPNDADLTADDLIALGQSESNSGKVEMLEGENDLDVPGADADDANEEIGEEDEENNYYSLGGDAHDDLEENKS